eukprot:5014014-Pyramimonas_sp.AAC.1
MQSAPGLYGVLCNLHRSCMGSCTACIGCSFGSCPVYIEYVQGHIQRVSEQYKVLYSQYRVPRCTLYGLYR